MNAQKITCGFTLFILATTKIFSQTFLLAPQSSPALSSMMFESSGRIGIGTPTPTEVLDVNGTGRFLGSLTAPRLKLTSGEIDGSGIIHLSPTGIGAIRVTVAPNANVGIGQNNTFSNGAANLVVGTSNILNPNASHNIAVGIANEVSGVYALAHGNENEIVTGFLSGYNYALGNQNKINFNMSMALNGLNYALGMQNEITSNSAHGLNYILGAVNSVDYTGLTGSEDAAGLNYIIGYNNQINVDQSTSEDFTVGMNYVSGVGNQISGNSVGCHQFGIGLSTTNAMAAFTLGMGNLVGEQPLVNNQSESFMVGFGSQSTFFVRDNHVGINTTTMGDAALRIKSRDIEGGAKLDLQSSGGEGWQNQIRFLSPSGSFRHIIADDIGSNNLLIKPGLDGSANAMVEIQGKLKIGNVATPSSTNSDYSLYVEKGILSERLKCAVRTTNDWSDFVFDDCYELRSLDEVAAYIKENKHLPDVPSAQQMVDSGLDVTKTSAVLLRKIEELTLYVIKLEEKLKEK